MSGGNRHPPSALPERIGRRYQVVNQIGRGGMGAVYRVIDRLTGQVVTLKRVLAEFEPTFGSEGRQQEARIALAREFQVLAGLRHPNIISVLDYGFDQGQPFFTMDLQEGAQPFVAAARPQPFAVQVDLLVQLLQALNYLHRRGILHRDVKPTNVLVVGGQVKVLDFGISISREEARGGDIVEGTLAYMAPEVLRGRAPSRASDLYAVGLMAYEVFVGRHPFDVANQGQLLADTVAARPDLSSPELDGRLRPLLERLLSKSPSDRYEGEAEAVIAALGEAIGRDLSTQTTQTRESFLQSAALVGRAAEMIRVRGMIGRIVAGDPGGSLLIGGESGAGKSRLLSEARTVGQVRGALVLRGQAVSEGGSPFQLLREPVRWLAIQDELSDAEASVLRPVLPDIGTVIGRPVSPAPPMEAGAMLARLLDTLEALFRRQEQPVLLLLEDLQWAGGEAILAARRLMDLARSRPLLVLGAWRDDEAPDLPAQLPDAELMRLPRLSPDAVAELSQFMLGPAGQRPEVVELLQRETEGNAFFLVEAVRALLEEGVGDGASGALPARILSGGVRRVAQRRLGRVSEPDRGALLLAAAIGRQIDPALLARVEPGLDLDAWQTRLINAAVLEPYDQGARFSHDKLREVLLDQAGPAGLRPLHRRIAEALDGLALEGRASALALHWEAAGEPAQELRWRVIAGEQAMQAGAYQDARRQFERALSLAEGTEASEVERARWRRMAAECCYVLGEDDAAFAHLERVMTAGGVRLPRSPGALSRMLVWQALGQARQALAPVRVVAEEARRALLVEMSRAAGRLCQRAIMASDQLGVLAYSLLAVNLADRAGSTVPYALGVAAFAATTLRLRGLSRRFFDRARAACAEDPFTFVEVALLETAALVGMGQLAEAERRAEVALAEALRIQHRLGVAGLAAIRGQCCSWPRARLGEGDLVVREALDGLQQGQGQAAQSAPFVGIYWLLQGRGKEGMGVLERAQSLVHRSQSLVSLTVGAALALLQCQLGQVEAARAQLDALHGALRVAGSIPPVCQHVFTALCETRLQVWREARSPEDEQRAAREARAALRSYASWARLYPVGWPEYWRFVGEAERLGGRAERARKVLERAVSESRRAEQPLHEALAHLSMARLDLLDQARRREHLGTARALLQGSGMVWYLRQLEELTAWVG